jgi:hypothetical protein
MREKQAIMQLPKGFRDIWHEEYLQAEAVFSAFRRRAHDIGCCDLVTSPVSCAEACDQGNNTTDDRIFRFKDKGGRDLVLTPDSYHAVLGWYLRERTFLPERVFFSSQVFRYRHQKYRHFTQIGFAIINEDSEEARLAAMARAAIKAVKLDLGVEIEIRVTDLSLWENLLKAEGHTPDAVKLIIKDIRFAESDAEKVAIVRRHILDEDRQKTLVFLLGCREVDNVQDHPMFAHSLSFARYVVRGLGCGYSVSPDNFHSSEFKNGLSFQLVTPAKEVCGEGGIMTNHAQKFSDKIKSYLSFCSGIEFFIRHRHAAVKVDLTRRALLVHASELHDEALADADALNTLGLSCILLPATGERPGILKSYIPRSGWLIRLKTQAGGVQRTLKNLLTGASETPSTRDALTSDILTQLQKKTKCT